MQTLTIHYTIGLVIVSVLISIGASFAALSLLDRVRAATAVGSRRFLLTSGSVAIAAPSVALSVVSREKLTARRLLGGGLLMGAGIGAMHYTGMAAMRSSAM